MAGDVDGILKAKVALAKALPALGETEDKQQPVPALTTTV